MLQSNSRCNRILKMSLRKLDGTSEEVDIGCDRVENDENQVISLQTENEPDANSFIKHDVSSSRSRTCSSSSSSSSSCSSKSNSSSSEDNDDILYDNTYIPDAHDINMDSDNEIQRVDAVPNQSTGTTTNASTSSLISNTSTILIASESVKRKRNESGWKRNLNKKFRNSGKEYDMHTEGKKTRPQRKIKPPCTEKCKVKCFAKFTEQERMDIFKSYWELGNLEKQRQFIISSMEQIQPKYRYVRVGGTRKMRDNNNAFYFHRNGERMRVCKLFFKNTLDINDRPIRTVQEKRNKLANVLIEEERRGKHGKQKTIDPVIKEGVKTFINKIPKIESHYTRANTSKLFIDGSKSVADLHRDYVSECKLTNVPYANYLMFYRIFTEFNISFFVPKKDLCETCVAYSNANEEEKLKLKEYYDCHLKEKDLSREEKKEDKEKPNTVVAVYDLQAVFQIPKGEVSVFYYRSKLNVLNFTIYDLKTNDCSCYVWDESNGHRGINELGTCVLNFINQRKGEEEDLIFFSDNCAGQQKNKFMIALYLYAVSHLKVKSITHKYLIKGHTQNEGDSAHSLIERQVKRQLKGGPMYTPESFISAIRAAKKNGHPFKVVELSYEDFFDIKDLAAQIGPLNMSQVKISQVKVLQVKQEAPTSLFYKTSYEGDFQEATIIRRKKTIEKPITLTRAFLTKPKIADNKKHDLLALVEKNHIPKYYKTFYENL